ncbi:hypothetical protein [Sporolactobacillus sp. KGMB 08714]|uniref:hypothetical protein n=1 Tax=Sporolactobacillus sp. KGMB 08714 TaxID=3064704 RepID=UPI002FBE0CD3
MGEALQNYKQNGESPTKKVINENRRWLHQALDVLFTVEHKNWHEDVSEGALGVLLTKKINREAIQKNIKEVQDNIQQSEILKSDTESVPAQIIARCAYPELIDQSKSSTTEELANLVKKIIEGLEKVHGDTVTTIAVNEVNKRLNIIVEDISFNYGKDKIFNEDFWRGLSNKPIKLKKKINVEKLLRERFQIEFEEIDKSTF